MYRFARLAHNHKGLVRPQFPLPALTTITMAKGKADRTKEESLVQKHRTAKNTIKRYSRLIVERPTNPHAKVWSTRVEKAEAVLK